MGFEDLIADANWTTSLPSLIVGLASAVLTYLGTTASVRKRLRLAEAEFERKYRLDDKTEAVLLELLRSPEYDMRTFEKIQSRIPLSDEKLRESLLRIGAVCFTQRGTGVELWGLLEKHRETVFGPGAGDPLN